MSAGRRSTALLVAALAVIAALWVWLEWEEPQGRAGPQPLTATGAPDTPAAGFTATTEPPVEPLAAEPTPGQVGARSPDDRASALPGAPDEEMPVVARGRVSCLPGLDRVGGRALLHDVDRRTLAHAPLDGQGRFELRWDQPLLAGWRVRVEDVLIRSENVFRRGSIATTGLLPDHWPGQPPQECPLVVGLPPILTLLVRSASDGAPIPGADVGLGPGAGPSSKDSRWGLTDGEGRLLRPLYDLPLEDLVIAVQAEGYQAAALGPLDIAPVARVDEAVVHEVALGGPQRLRGRIVDAATGMPLPGARLYLDSRYEIGRWPSGWEGVDGTGRFDIDAERIVLPAAWLLASAPGHGPALLSAPEPWRQLELRLGPPAELTVHVVDAATGLPVESAAITVRQARELSWGPVAVDSAFCGAQGRGRLSLEEVPPEVALVQVVAGGYAPWEGRLTELGSSRGPLSWELVLQLRRMPGF